MLPPLKFNGWNPKSWRLGWPIWFSCRAGFSGEVSRSPEPGRMDGKMVPQFFGVVGHSTCGKGFANTQRCTDGLWQCWWRFLEPCQGEMGFGCQRARGGRGVSVPFREGLGYDNYEGWCDPWSTVSLTVWGSFDHASADPLYPFMFSGAHLITLIFLHKICAPWYKDRLFLSYLKHPLRFAFPICKPERTECFNASDWITVYIIYKSSPEDVSLFKCRRGSLGQSWEISCL